ncbi:hypothetical protein D3C79_1092370 [compost metagenome]
MAKSTFAPVRPPSKIVCVALTPIDQSKAGALNKLLSWFASLPYKPDKPSDGK